LNIVLLHSVLTRLVKVRKSKQFEMASTFKDFVIKTILHRIASSIKKPVTTTAVTTTTTFTSTATTAVTTVLTTITETTSAAE